MFGFKKPLDDLDDAIPQRELAVPPPMTPPLQAMPAPTPPTRSIQPTPLAAPRGTEIAADTRILGDIKADSGLSVAGEVRGNIEADGVITVQESATIKGDVHGTDVVVRGKVEGQVIASAKLTISTTGLVVGDIEVRSLLIEDGGTLQGQCRMGATRSEATAATPPPIEASNANYADEDISQFLPDLASGE
ncbi:MAG: polymer-forming cytoskeletal protein [Nannocystaceae bacterium]